MMSVDSPPNTVHAGSILIQLSLGKEGMDIAYSFDGVTPEAAIGYLTVVTDRLREERSRQWNTCPGCGLPYDECEDGNDDVEDDEDDE